MATKTLHKAGSLTIYSTDRSEIYGELTDANWVEQESDGDTQVLLSGTASDGTMETLQRVNSEGTDTVTFDYESDGEVYEGSAFLLRPQSDGTPGGNVITIETRGAPVQR